MRPIILGVVTESKPPCKKRPVQRKSCFEVGDGLARAWQQLFEIWPLFVMVWFKLKLSFSLACFDNYFERCNEPFGLLFLRQCLIMSTLSKCWNNLVFEATISNFRQCTMGLSPFNKCIREICPFAPIFQGNNCFRVKYLKITFTFNIYLGTSWKEATAAKEAIEIFTGWWKDVL